MPRITPIDWKTLVKIFELFGCHYKRKEGSHHILTYPGARRAVVIPELQAIWYILSGIRYTKEFLDRFLRREALMESTTYKAILEEGIEKGIENGYRIYSSKG